MSLRNNSLQECICDVVAHPAEADRAARETLGREVLSALGEIDRMASATAPSAGPAAAAGAITNQLVVSVSSLSPGMCITAASLTTIGGISIRH